MTQNNPDTYQGTTIAGYFDDSSKAERALQDLREAGFSSAHLGVAHRGGTSTNSTTKNVAAKGESMWDKVKNFFEGGPAEPYADERSRGDLATREVTTDPYAPQGYDYDYKDSDVHKSLREMSIPDDRSRYLGHKFGSSEDGAVITVNAGDRRPEAEAILKRNGADLGENASTYDYPDNTTSNAPVEGTQNIQLLGEVLRVHKERENLGDVRIRKEVVTENQTVQIPVTREELVIERRSVNGEEQANGTVGEGSEIRIPLTEERASVDKSTVVREEVSVGKKAINETRNLSGEIRHEELVVDDQSKQRRNGQATNEDAFDREESLTR